MAKELTNNLPAPRKPCPLTTPRLLPRRKQCLLIRLIPKERTLLRLHHRTTRKPTARAREVDADSWRREQRMPHRRPAVEIWRTRKRHHQTLLPQNPRAETKEATPQPNLPRRKEREAIRLSHLPRKKAKDLTPRHNRFRKKARE